MKNNIYSFFLFNLYYNKYIVIASKINKVKLIFYVFFNIINHIILTKKYKKSLIRSPHVDKKSKEKFISVNLTIIFFSNIYLMKKLFIKTLLINSWFNIFLQKLIKKQYFLIFVKKYFL